MLHEGAEDLMYSPNVRRLFSQSGHILPPGAGALGTIRPGSGTLPHLRCMTSPENHDRPLEPVLALSDIAAHLGVPIQTLYDIRLAGRGPHGFRVGRQPRFRLSEIRDWLARLEAEDRTHSDHSDHSDWGERDVRDIRRERDVRASRASREESAADVRR